MSRTDNKNAEKWRRHCTDKLEELAAEKLFPDSLTNLPIGSEIELNTDSEEKVILVKEQYGEKKPIWVDTITNAKYKINKIQQTGYKILSRA